MTASPRAPLRIALTSPFAHPYVRRGAERYVHELAAWLAGRGHDVTVLTTSPDPTHRVTTDGVRVIYAKRGPAFGRGRGRVDDLLRAVTPIARAVRYLDVDVAQCHHYVDAVGLRLGRLGRARVPYVLWLPGAPPSTAFGGRPLHRAAFRAASRGAARVHSLSAYAAKAHVDGFGVVSDVVPPGVHTARYAGPRPAADEPIVLFTAAADDPRKRLDVLLRAFPLVRTHRPAARLVLAPPHADAARAAVDAAGTAGVEVREGVGLDALAALYREAAVTVLPSVEEAFGLVLVESLAAGTPVVGAATGGIPDIVRDRAVGRLFPPDDPGALAEAIVDTLDLSADPSTAHRCRAAARAWDWEEVGPRIEGVYRAVAAPD